MNAEGGEQQFSPTMRPAPPARFLLVFVAMLASTASCGSASTSIRESSRTTAAVRASAEDAFAENESRPPNDPGASVAGQKREVPPSRVDAPPVSEKIYPTDRYLVGRGQSERGPAEAASQAAADIANQIRSTLRSLLVSKVGKNASGEYETTEQVVVQEGEFEHAELIRQDRSQAAFRGGYYYATAVLDRREAADVLSTDFAHTSEDLRRLARSANESLGVPTDFARHFREAKYAFDRALGLALRIQILTGATPAAMAEEENVFAGLLDKREKVLGRLRLVVVPDSSVDPNVWEAIGNALAGAFTQLGLSSTTGVRCVGDLGLLVKASTACSRSYLGPRCTVEASAVLVFCNKNIEIAPIDLGSTRTRAAAADPRDEGLARKKVLEKLSAEALVPVIRPQVERFLPVR